MDRGLTLPSHHGLSSDAVGHIAESLEAFLRDPE
jgi:dTDP-4-amino-4,6-dideoxygalactose transaminase